VRLDVIVRGVRALRLPDISLSGAVPDDVLLAAGVTLIAIGAGQ
jgi:hypothetical protein